MADRAGGAEVCFDHLFAWYSGECLLFRYGRVACWIDGSWHLPLVFQPWRLGALYAYTPEQYPTSIRATGAGMAAAFGRIGGIFGPLLVGSLVTQGVSVTAIFTLFCLSVLVAVLAVAVLGKETKQQELV